MAKGRKKAPTPSPAAAAAPAAAPARPAAVPAPGAVRTDPGAYPAERVRKARQDHVGDADGFEAAYDDLLLAAFRAQFKQPRVNAATMRKMLGTRSCRKWYATWKAAHALESALPDHWADAGLTAAEWAEADDARTARKDARREFANEREKLAEAYQKDLASIDAREEAELGELATDLTKTLEVNFEDLALADQIAIEMSTSKNARAAALNNRLERMRAAKVATLRGTTGA